jgi:hypothetical protein
VLPGGGIGFVVERTLITQKTQIITEISDLGGQELSSEAFERVHP